MLAELLTEADTLGEALVEPEVDVEDVGDGLGHGDAVSEAVWVTLGDEDREAETVGEPERVSLSDGDVERVCDTLRDGDVEPVCEAEADALPVTDCDQVPVFV